MVKFAASCPKMLMCACAVALAYMPPSCLFVPAHAQESGLIKKLAELTERKGYKDAFLREWICEAFDWSASDCDAQVTFQAPYDEKDGIVHAFDSVRIPGQPLRAVLIVHDKRSGYAFWTDPDGTLRGCLRSQLGDPELNEWQGKKSSCDETDVRSRFASEITYWRTKLVALENVPDRKD
jgi:hypothetical protein